MTWLSNNWFWLLVGIGFVLTHVFGHGGHGGHGAHRDHRRDADPSSSPAGRDDPAEANPPSRPHH